jgi:hypothetical protein
MGEQMFTVKSEVVGQPFVVGNDFVQSVGQKFMEYDASKSKNFRVNFHKFQAFFCTKLSQLGWAIVTNLCKIGSENAHGCAQNAQNGFDFDFFRAILQRWR